MIGQVDGELAAVGLEVVEGTCDDFVDRDGLEAHRHGACVKATHVEQVLDEGGESVEGLVRGAQQLVPVGVGEPYVEALETRRYDAGAVGQFLVKGRYVVTARAAVARQSHDHQFGEVLERDRHDTVFAEAAVRGATSRQTWVVGVAMERDALRSRDAPQFDYSFTAPGAFVQYDVTLTPTLSVSSKLPFRNCSKARSRAAPPGANGAITVNSETVP